MQNLKSSAALTNFANRRTAARQGSYHKVC